MDHSSMMEMLRKIDERLENGNMRFTAIEDGLKTMAKDVSATKEIVEAYSTVKNVGRFVKWFGAFVAGIIAIGVGVKSGMIWLLAGLK